MLIDTHTHIPSLDGVDKIIYASADPKNVQTVFEAAQTNRNIFCTIGIHPEYSENFESYEQLLDNPKVVGVGEIGLDYHYGKDDRTRQIDLFIRQLGLARKYKLPVAIHSRDADDDTAAILKDVDGVMHCFTGSYDFAKIMLDRGFLISASGIVTFKNAADLRETFSKIPTDMLIAETDAPFCAPVPFRGQESTPAMVAETIKCLATIKNMSNVEMEDILWNNAHRLYKKLCHDKL